MILAAKEACQRRRILVQRLYEVKFDLNNTIKMLHSGNKSPEVELKINELTKKVEALV